MLQRIINKCGCLECKKLMRLLSDLCAISFNCTGLHATKNKIEMKVRQIEGLLGEIRGLCEKP